MLTGARKLRARVRAIRRDEESPRDREWSYWPWGWTSNGRMVKGWDAASVAMAQRNGWSRMVAMTSSTDPLATFHYPTNPDGQDHRVHEIYMSYGYVLCLTARMKQSMSILDWGSGLGHYYLVSRTLLPGVVFDYHCQDLPEMCRVGRELLPDVAFHDTLEECLVRKYDLVVASSSLQYQQDWQQTAKDLASVAGEHLYVARLPVVMRAPSYVVFQRAHRHGCNSDVLSWVTNRSEFLSYMQGLGLKLIREFLVAERPLVHGAPEQGQSRSFLFRPVDSSR